MLFLTLSVTSVESLLSFFRMRSPDHALSVEKSSTTIERNMGVRSGVHLHRSTPETCAPISRDRNTGSTETTSSEGLIK